MPTRYWYLNDRWEVIKIRMTYFCVGLAVNDTSWYLRNDCLHPHPHPSNSCYSGWGVLASISMVCMQIEMFPVSVIAPNATMVICWLLFGGIHPIHTGYVVAYFIYISILLCLHLNQKDFPLAFLVYLGFNFFYLSTVLNE